MDVFCWNCRVLLCPRCALFGHHNHSVKESKDAYAALLPEVQKVVTVTKAGEEILIQSKERVVRAKANVQTKANEAERSVHVATENIIALARSREQKLVDEIRAMEAVEVKALETQQLKLSTQIESVQDVHRIGAQAIEDKSPVAGIQNAMLATQRHQAMKQNGYVALAPEYTGNISFECVMTGIENAIKKTGSIEDGECKAEDCVLERGIVRDGKQTFTVQAKDKKGRPASTMGIDAWVINEDRGEGAAAAVAAQVNDGEAEAVILKDEGNGMYVIEVEAAKIMRKRQVQVMIRGQHVRNSPIETDYYCVAQFKQSSCAHGAAVSEDGRYIVSGSADKIVRVWGLGTWERIVELVGHTNDVQSVAVSVDGKYIVSGGDDKTVRVWSVGTWQRVAVLKGHTNYVQSVAVSGDGRYIISGSGDTTVRVWDTATWKCIAELKGHTKYVESVAMSRDGQYIVSGSYDNTVRVWSVGEWKCVAVLVGHTNYVQSIAVSGDGRYIVSGGYDNTVRVWDVGTWQSVAVLTGHSDSVQSVAVSRDGRHIASGSADTTVRLWGVGTWDSVAVLQAHSSWVHAIAMSADCRYIVSSSFDFSVRVWGM